MTANIDNKTRKSIYRRDGFQCALCGYRSTLQIYHVIPRGQGGLNTEQNLITLCMNCHALAHGNNIAGWVDMTQEDISQLCIEYLADMYTDEHNIWCGWE